MLVLQRSVRHGFAELALGVELLVLKLVLHLRLMVVRRWASALRLALADGRRTSRLRMSLSTHDDGFLRSQTHRLLEVTKQIAQSLLLLLLILPTLLHGNGFV